MLDGVKESRRFFLGEENSKMTLFEIKKINPFKSIYEEIKKIEFPYKGPNAILSLLRNCNTETVCIRKDGFITFNARFLSDMELDDKAVYIAPDNNSRVFQKEDGFIIEEGEGIMKRIRSY